MPAVEVRSRVVGANPDTLTPAPIILALLTEKVTVGALIRATVTEQIHDLILNRQMDADAAREILARQYLTPTEVQHQAEQGFIHTPTVRAVQPRSIDTEVEIEKALTAFQNGIYYILIDGRQYDALDNVVALEPRSKMTFLRLTPLRGG